MTELEIIVGSSAVWKAVSAIIVPENAVSEPGYIKTIAAAGSESAKHEFFAMAQMAYYQHEDGELVVQMVSEPLAVRQADQLHHLECGMLIFRNQTGEIQVLLHQQLNARKMLETTNRYCTRWVRLDI